MGEDQLEREMRKLSGDSNILCLDRGLGYTDVYMGQNSVNGKLKLVLVIIGRHYLKEKQTINQFRTLVNDTCAEAVYLYLQLTPLENEDGLMDG